MFALQTLEPALAGLDTNTTAANVNCLKNMFYLGETDFWNTPRCLVQNYLLLVFTSILCASIMLKSPSLLAGLYSFKHPTFVSPFRAYDDSHRGSSNRYLSLTNPCPGAIWALFKL